MACVLCPPGLHVSPKVYLCVCIRVVPWLRKQFNELFCKHLFVAPAVVYLIHRALCC